MTNTANPESLYALIRLVRPLYKALETAVILELKPRGISVPQRAVLDRILEDGPMTVPAIGRSLILPRQFIQKLADELITAGLLEKRDNAAHKRSPLLHLTEDGAALISAVRAREAEVMRPIAAALAADDVAVAAEVMQTTITAFQTHNAAHPSKEQEIP